MILKFQFAYLTCRTALLLSLLLAAQVIGQEASNIDSFEAATVSLGFPSSDGDYHLVEASRDLQKWVIVGQYPGNGKPTQLKDLRGQLGNTHFYQVVTKSKPFPNGLLDRKWKLVALHLSLIHI